MKTWAQSKMLCWVCLGPDCLAGDCSHYGPSPLLKLFKFVYLKRKFFLELGEAQK